MRNSRSSHIPKHCSPTNRSWVQVLRQKLGYLPYFKCPENSPQSEALRWRQIRVAKKIIHINRCVISNYKRCWPPTNQIVNLRWLSIKGDHCKNTFDAIAVLRFSSRCFKHVKLRLFDSPMTYSWRLIPPAFQSTQRLSRWSLRYRQHLDQHSTWESSQSIHDALASLE